jgi:hypothetical protein
MAGGGDGSGQGGGSTSRGEVKPGLGVVRTRDV